MKEFSLRWVYKLVAVFHFWYMQVKFLTMTCDSGKMRCNHYGNQIWEKGQMIQITGNGGGGAVIPIWYVDFKIYTFSITVFLLMTVFESSCNVTHEFEPHTSFLVSLGHVYQLFNVQKCTCIPYKVKKYFTLFLFIWY